jgi:protein O-GlcNAc transferase
MYSNKEPPLTIPSKELLMTNKIICFSLWGDNPKYTMGAIKNARLAQEIYEGWKCRFYIGNDVSNKIIDQLDSLNCELVHKDDTGWNGMFWRFLGADSENIFLSRDTDSRLNTREKAAVDEWLKTDKDFHIMRDHPYHQTEILGGMWGCRNGILKGITEMIDTYDKKEYDNAYQVDQNFLRQVIYPMIKYNSTVHDEFFERIPFPSNATQRARSYFVGQVYDENDIPQF